MRTSMLLLVALLMNGLVQAQVNETISVGASYANATYYKLSDGSTQSHTLSDWDIAFSVFSTTTGGIFINEGQSLSGGGAIKLYLAPTNNFNDTISSSALGTELKNAEIDWSNGAFNANKNAGNFADYGWGSYSMITHKIEGSTVFVVQLRDTSYKKMKIDTLTNGTYYFRYADLDGANLQQHSIAKSSFSGNTLAYFSLTNNAVVNNIEPSAGWDLLFTRYETVLDNSGTPMDYLVTGVLSNEGVEIAKADGVNPSTVDVNNYSNQFSADSLTIIGHEWKEYDFSSGWLMDTDLVFFVRTADSSLYKLRFIDFEGSVTGVTRVERTSLGNPTSVQSIENTVKTFDVYPNPVRDQASLVLTLEEAVDLNVQLFNAQGQQVKSLRLEGDTGLNAWELDFSALSSGMYFLSVQTPQGNISKQLIIR